MKGLQNMTLPNPHDFITNCSCQQSFYPASIIDNSCFSTPYQNSENEPQYYKDQTEFFLSSKNLIIAFFSEGDEKKNLKDRHLDIIMGTN